MTPTKLRGVLIGYAVLAIVSGFVIQGDLRIRLVLWAVLAGLAIKSIAAYKLQQMPPPEGREREPGEGEDAEV